MEGRDTAVDEEREEEYPPDLENVDEEDEGRDDALEERLTAEEDDDEDA